MIPKQPKLQLPLEFRIKKRLNLVMEKKKIVIIALFTGLILAAAISFLLPKSYRSSSKIFFKSSTVNSNILSSNTGLKNELELMNSESLLKNAAQSLAQEGFAVSVNDIIESTELYEDMGSNAISVNIVSDEAVKSAKINNILIQKFHEYCVIHNKAALVQVLKSLKERDEALQDNIRTSLASQQGSGIFTMNAQQDLLINQIAEFESELEIAEIENQYLLNNLQDLESTLDSQFPEVSSVIKVISNTEFNSTKLKLQRLEAKNNLSQLTSKLNNFNIEYPWQEKYNISDISNVYNSFNDILEKQLDGIISNSAIKNPEFLIELTKKIYENRIKTAGIDLTKSIIFNTMTNLEDRFNLIPYEIIDEVRRARTKKFNTTLGLKLKTIEKRFRENENSLFAEIDSITEAKVPASYFSPNPTLNILLGGLLGLIIGLFFAATSDTVKIELIKSVEDLEEAGYKVVAQIPTFPFDSPLLFDELNETDEKKIDPKVLRFIFKH